MKNLLTKLNLIMGEVPIIEKTGRNKLQNYDYLTEFDLKLILQPLFIKHKVIFRPVGFRRDGIEITKTKSGSTMFITHGVMTFEFADADSGETMQVAVPTSGMDTGDKFSFKETTGGEKYALKVALMIPTGDDPEKDAHSNGTGRATTDKPLPEKAPQAAPQPSTNGAWEPKDIQIKTTIDMLEEAKRPAAKIKATIDALHKCGNATQALIFLDMLWLDVQFSKPEYEAEGRDVHIVEATGGKVLTWDDLKTKKNQVAAVVAYMVKTHKLER